MSDRVLPWVGLGLAGTATGLGLYFGLRSDKPKGGSTSATTEGGQMAKGLIWPIAWQQQNGVGDSLLAHRKSTGSPHRGLDIYAEPQTPVRSAIAGRVLRVQGSPGPATVEAGKERTPAERAGLFVDVRGEDGRIYRYLHLSHATVKAGQRIAQNTPIGAVAPTGTSGNASTAPHLHFEIRASDWDRVAREYGEPIDPLGALPLRLKEHRSA